MLLYNFNNTVIDLSTFISISDDLININNELLINNYKNYYTITDFEKYLNGSYQELNYDFEIIQIFLNNAFFKIYSKITDLEIFHKLFDDIILSEELIKVYKAYNNIKNKIFTNDSIKSFYNYNIEFKNNINSFNNNFLINWNKDFFNWKENYSTFRITNSFVNLSNSEILHYIKSDYNIFELDVKASDLLFVLFLSFLHNKNKDLLKKIYNSGVYNIVKSLESENYNDKKLELLISLYSITKNTILSVEQKNIIKELNLEYLVNYLINNEQIILCNGIKRKNEHPIAIYGQSATSIFIRHIINSLKIYLEKNNKGKIIYSKYDSIVFEYIDDIFDINKFFVYINGTSFNFCGKDYLIDENMENIFNMIFRKNYKIKKLK